MYEKMMKKKNKKAEIIEKNLQGTKDRTLLFRDASVYEANFARSNDYALRNYIDKMVDDISESNNEFSGLVK